MRRLSLTSLMWASLAFGGSSIGIFLIDVPPHQTLRCGGVSAAVDDAFVVNATLNRRRASFNIEDPSGEYVRYCDLFLTRRPFTDHESRHTAVPLNARCGRLGPDGPELFESKLQRLDDLRLLVTWSEPAAGKARVVLTVDPELKTMSVNGGLVADNFNAPAKILLNDSYPCVVEQ